jgi:hypothetical protein
VIEDLQQKVDEIYNVISIKMNQFHFEEEIGLKEMKEDKNQEKVLPKFCAS